MSFCTAAGKDPQPGAKTRVQHSPKSRSSIFRLVCKKTSFCVSWDLPPKRCGHCGERGQTSALRDGRGWGEPRSHLLLAQLKLTELLLRGKEMQTVLQCCWTNKKLVFTWGPLSVPAPAHPRISQTAEQVLKTPQQRLKTQGNTHVERNETQLCSWAV